MDDTRLRLWLSERRLAFPGAHGEGQRSEDRMAMGRIAIEAKISDRP